MPISSYYLLHGKYSAQKGSGGSKQSKSVKTADLVPQTVLGGAKIMTMSQITSQIAKANAPKAHSHGLTTPSAINSLHILTQSPKKGMMMNVP